MTFDIQTSLAVIRDYSAQNDKGFSEENFDKALDLYKVHYTRVFNYCYMLEYPNATSVPNLDECGGIHCNPYQEVGYRVYMLTFHTKY